MAKILGLDIGRASIGIAISDNLQVIASPIKTIKYQNSNHNQFINHLKQLIAEFKINEIVYGLPLNMDGSKSDTTHYIEEIITMAKKEIDLPFHSVDERWSSKAAQKLIVQANFKKSQRKVKNDQVAAAIILQTFLESHM